MSERDAEAEPRDYAKMLWLGVAGLVALMVAALVWSGRQTPGASAVRAKHILITFNPNDPAERVRALDLITSLRQRIEKGERFERIAESYSNDPTTSVRGGDLGWRPRGTFDPGFEEYVWNAPVGALSDIITTAYGFHLIVVSDRHISSSEVYEKELERRALEEERKLRNPDGETGGAPAQP